MQPNAKEVSWLWGLLILLGLTLHTLHKIEHGILPEMLWACHIASFGIALAVFFRWPQVANVGLLFHAGMGVLAYVIDALASMSTTVTSVLVHLVPGLVGLLMASRWGYAKQTLLRCVLFVLGVQILSYLATPPALNINLVFSPWGFLTEWFDSLWLYRLFNFAFACVLLTLADWALRRAFKAVRA